MIGQLRSVVLECKDPYELAGFYQAILGGNLLKEDDTWSVLTDPDGRRLAFQLAPEHERPQFPDPRGSQQFHLDIRVRDDGVDDAERDVRPGRPHLLPGVGHLGIVRMRLRTQM